jgi:hypothetical protein
VKSKFTCQAQERSRLLCLDLAIIGFSIPTQPNT